MKNFWLPLMFAMLTVKQPLLAATTPQHEGIESQMAVSLTTPAATFSIPIQSWKTLRDARIVKQDLDYSCSAASLATLLNEFYGQSVTEEALLKAMDISDIHASFEDMQKALPQVTSN